MMRKQPYKNQLPCPKYVGKTQMQIHTYLLSFLMILSMYLFWLCTRQFLVLYLKNSTQVNG